MDQQLIPEKHIELQERNESDEGSIEAEPQTFRK